ncbi:hypothetical protein [Paenibacillus tianjinensis]|uniref:Uncharacterized protein n=1 Tax=Paenibacillus tianjinensis TaxID=2810347 RepID=A0ABX7L7V9_9BACL|nr:hypothetical protein [Paenibacillus tianjinensis]QSF43421.1 hypothetical protein JRJ22_19345 [Paenibacillus tianjinensis]
MKIIRNEIGKYEGIPSLKDFSITEINGDDYSTIAMALHYSTEHYENNNMTEPGTVNGDTYHRMKFLLAKMTDYRNHDRTFNGETVRPYSETKIQM